MLAVCQKSQLVPAQNGNFERWEAFIRHSSRHKVSKVYSIWSKFSDLSEPEAQRVECILRRKLQYFDKTVLTEDFVRVHEKEILWVKSEWSSQVVANYVREEFNADAPCLVVDTQYRFRGIAITKDFVLAGVVNFATSVDEAQYLYSVQELNPLTNRDAVVLMKNRKVVQHLLKECGQPSICGYYLMVDRQCSHWIGKRLSFGIGSVFF